MSACNVCEARRAFLRELAKRFVNERKVGDAATLNAGWDGDLTPLAESARTLLDAEKA